MIKTLTSGLKVIDGDLISKWVEQNGRLDHDQNMLPLLQSIIQVGGTVLDVGAYIGDHTLFYRNCVGPKGKVIAFEPNKEPHECLRHNMEVLGFFCDGTVKCMNVGLWSSSAEAYIEKQNESNLGATSLNIYNYDKCIDSRELIALITIDSLNLNECHFIKIDAEGAEFEILKGGEKTIERFRPVLLIEILEHGLNKFNASSVDIYSFLDKFGYSYHNIYGGQPMSGQQYDIIAIPKDHVKAQEKEKDGAE